MNSQRTALALTEKRGWVCHGGSMGSFEGGGPPQRESRSMPVSFHLPLQNTFSPGKWSWRWAHSSSWGTLWRSRRCCRDTQNILSKRPHRHFLIIVWSLVCVAFESDAYPDTTDHLIIRLFFGFASVSLSIKLMQKEGRRRNCQKFGKLCYATVAMQEVRVKS